MTLKGRINEIKSLDYEIKSRYYDFQKSFLRDAKVVKKVVITGYCFIYTVIYGSLFRTYQKHQGLLTWGLKFSGSSTTVISLPL